MDLYVRMGSRLTYRALGSTDGLLRKIRQEMSQPSASSETRDRGTVEHSGLLVCWEVREVRKGARTNASAELQLVLDVDLA